MTNSEQNFPFPFIGAGEASYFEWAEVHVEFAREPSEREKAAIAERVPPPLRDSIDFTGTHLLVASDQFAHMSMAETYEASEDDREEEDDIEEDEYEERFFFAKDSQVHAFNQDIEAWLRYSHEQCPIRVAFRAEDYESGGTELSDWHEWSVKQVPALLDQKFKSVLETTEDTEDKQQNRYTYMVHGILQLARETNPDLELPEEFLEWLSPGYKEAEALRAEDEDALRALLSKTPSIRKEILMRLGEEVDEENKQQCKMLIRLTDVWIRQSEFPSELFVPLCKIALLSKFDDAYEELHKPIDAWLAHAKAQIVEDPELAEHLGYLGYRLLTEDKNYPAALELYNMIIELSSLEKTAYCNALWVVQSDNNKLPLDPERSRRFLQYCLPHAPENPAIFFNAACVYMELGERDKVLESLKNAVEHGYDDIHLLEQQVLHESLFRPVANDPEVLRFFDDVRNKNK